MEIEQGLWKYGEVRDLLIYKKRGWYCTNKFLDGVNQLANGGDGCRHWGNKNLSNLKLPSHFIFNN